MKNNCNDYDKTTIKTTRIIRLHYSFFNLKHLPVGKASETPLSVLHWEVWLQNFWVIRLRHVTEELFRSREKLSSTYPKVECFNSRISNFLCWGLSNFKEKFFLLSHAKASPCFFLRILISDLSSFLSEQSERGIFQDIFTLRSYEFFFSVYRVAVRP